MWNKLLGAISFLLGVLIVIFFPDITRYQAESMGMTGIIFGFGLIALGVYLWFS
jgi:multisubunit Na+/H+ antiporter MnhG subunit